MAANGRSLRLMEVFRTVFYTPIYVSVAGGFLEMDIHGYGGLSITQQGRGLLTGDETFRYRRDTMRRADAGRRRKKPAVSAAIPEGAPESVPEGVPEGEPANELSPAQAALLEKLKALRLGLARERDVPAFVVFHDKSLEDMARRRPQTAAEFAEVHGVGEAKLRDFAEPFLAAIATGTSQKTEDRSQGSEDRDQVSGIKGHTVP